MAKLIKNLPESAEPKDIAARYLGSGDPELVRLVDEIVRDFGEDYRRRVATENNEAALKMTDMLDRQA